MIIKQVTGARNLSKLQKRKIDYIVVHYTAGVTSRKGSAINTAHWFRNSQCQGSADYIVDDGEIVQYNADVENHYTWHCGGAKYNNKGGKLIGKVLNANSIGIELCSNNKLKKMMQGNHESYYFTPATLDNAEKIIKHLMVKYNIPASHIVRHYDCTGKLCPGIHGWNADSGSEKEWEAFKARFKKKSILDIIKKKKTFAVKVKVGGLAIFESPAKDSKIVGTIKDKGVYTISKEKKGWGKLKSGAGWILLTNTERV